MTEPERLVAEARARRRDAIAGAVAWAFLTIWAAACAAELVRLALGR